MATETNSRAREKIVRTPVTVVIPTHNRREHVLRILPVLRGQECSGDLDIIVSCDRCTDGTKEAVQARFGTEVRVLDATAPGQTGACNTGALAAREGILVFLDDDMEPRDGFLEAHLQAHLRHDGTPTAVIGYSQPVVSDHATALQMRLAAELEGFFQAMSEPTHQFSPMDLTGANFSLPRWLLLSLGGFNETYTFQRNDFELATRLMEADVRFVFEISAHSLIHMDLEDDKMLARMPERARNELRLLTEHPWCRAFLPFFTPGNERRLRRRLLWELAPMAAPILDVLRKIAPKNPMLLSLACISRYTQEVRRQIGTWGSYDQLVRPAVPAIPICRHPKPADEDP